MKYMYSCFVTCCCPLRIYAAAPAFLPPLQALLELTFLEWLLGQSAIFSEFQAHPGNLALALADAV